MVTLPSLKCGCQWFQFEALNDLRREFDEHSRRQDALRRELSVGHLEDIMRVGTVEADEAAEALAEAFLDSEWTVTGHRRPRGCHMSSFYPGLQVYEQPG